ncbi:unnamed protein product, partial [Musa hybrid cultivar]
GEPRGVSKRNQNGALGLVVHDLNLFPSVPIALLRRRSGDLGKTGEAGFFHPYTNDVGGGERVLWCAVKAVQEENPDLDCAVFTGDDASPQSLSARALDRFGVKLLRPPQIKDGFAEGKDLVVTMMFAMGEEQICAIKDIGPK